VNINHQHFSLRHFPAYTLDRGLCGGQEVGGGGHYSFEQRACGVTDDYDGDALRPDGGYVGADSSSLVSIEGFRNGERIQAKLRDIDGTPNLKVDFEVDEQGRSKLNVLNPGQNGAFSLLSFEFGEVEDSNLFGTSRPLAEQVGQLSYIASEGTFAVALQNPNGTIAVFGNQGGVVGEEVATGQAW
jgi:hypothetical protein